MEQHKLIGNSSIEETQSSDYISKRVSNLTKENTCPHVPMHVGVWLITVGKRTDLRPAQSVPPVPICAMEKEKNRVTFWLQLQELASGRHAEATMPRCHDGGLETASRGPADEANKSSLSRSIAEDVGTDSPEAEKKERG